MIDRNDSDERQARIDSMIETFRVAQQRRLVKRGIVRWNRAEAAQAAMAWSRPQAPAKVH